MTGNLPQRTRRRLSFSTAQKKMLAQPWITQMKAALAQTNNAHPRLALVGVGHELRGDDAAGIAAARSLLALSGENWLILDAGSAPENFTGRLRAFTPDLVVILDAAQMDESPGTIRLFNISDTQNYSPTTHTLSFDLFARYLERELKCRVTLLGIQPEQDVLGAALSSGVRHSVHAIVAGFRHIHHESQRTHTF